MANEPDVGNLAEVGVVHLTKVGGLTAVGGLGPGQMARCSMNNVVLARPLASGTSLYAVGIFAWLGYGAHYRAKGERK